MSLHFETISSNYQYLILNMVKKFYAVLAGKQTGIFTSWDETKKLVLGYPRAIYKSFSTYNQAQQYMDGIRVTISPWDSDETSLPSPSSFDINNDQTNSNDINKTSLTVYTDGSAKNNKGGFLKVNLI